MRSSRPDQTTTAEHCGYCGHRLAPEAPVIERFGERFCSEAHADEFAAGVRAARMRAAGHAEELQGAAARGAQSWMDTLKRSLCWGAPLLLLLAIPLFWSGSALAAAGGSLLSVLALLACPLGMYFMMRMMMGHGQDRSSGPGGSGGQDRSPGDQDGRPQ